MRKEYSPAAIGALVLFVAPTDLAAQYLDPGGSSILVQVLLAGIAGVAALLKLYWGRIRARFGRRDKADQR
ncbi:MAG: hypothetical protein ACOY71_12695 [Gemmatimonadota bacterium]